MRTADQVLSDWRYFLEVGPFITANDEKPISHIDGLIKKTRSLLHKAFDRQVEVIDLPLDDDNGEVFAQEPQSIKQILAQRLVPQAGGPQAGQPISTPEPPRTLPKPLNPSSKEFVNPVLVSRQMDVQAAQRRHRYFQAAWHGVEAGILVMFAVLIVWLIRR